MNLFDKPTSISAGRRLARWLPVALMLIAILVTRLGPFPIKQQIVYYISMLLIFGPIFVRGAEKSGKIEENTYLSIIAKSTFLAGIMILPLKIAGVEWHISIALIVIWCLVVFFALNNDLYGEFNPVLNWNESTASPTTNPGSPPPESDQDGADEPGEGEPPPPQ